MKKTFSYILAFLTTIILSAKSYADVIVDPFDGVLAKPGNLTEVIIIVGIIIVVLLIAVYLILKNFKKNKNFKNFKN